MSFGPAGDGEFSGEARAPADRSDPALARPFELTEPEELSCPLVFSSPHSGNVYPARFLEKTRLDAATLRRSEDAHVDALFSAATAVGAPLLRAHVARAYLDLNREAYELDPRMFEDPLPDFANTRSLRVAAGLGTIPKVVADAMEIYAGPLQVDEALARIERVYEPYHLMLRQLMERARQRFGVAVLIDCHSMPSGVARDNSVVTRREKRKADFVIGDRFGVSCSAEIVATIEAGLRKAGYHVQRNRPYAGGFITEHYGRPGAGWHAVQIEVARGLYMDEKNLRRNDDFDAVAGHIGDMVRQLGQAAAGVGEQRAAAE